MKKKRKLKYLLMIALVAVTMTIGIKVKASNECDAILLNELQEQARNISVTYEETSVTNKDEDGNSVYGGLYLAIKIYNVTTNMQIKVRNESTKENIATFDYHDIGIDGTISFLRTAYGDTPIDYTFEITSIGDCYGERIRTIKLTVPFYNEFSDYEVCDGVSDYYLCDRFVFSKVDKNTANEKIDEYKKELSDKETNEAKEKEERIKQKNNQYKYYIVIGILLIGIALTIVIVRKKGSELNEK